MHGPLNVKLYIELYFILLIELGPFPLNKPTGRRYIGI
jgi:hypothetical protein